MRQVTIHEAKTHLSRLIEYALQGEEIVIAKGRNPLVKIVPLSRKKPARKAGGARGVIRTMAADFDAPLPDFHDYAK
jgi:antitoxin (DNA-binding transcriptional repressor) of toxin-antitoxin stability system